MSAKPTLGAYLRRGRERSGLSMDAVAAGSRIVPRLVEALEADRQDLLPAPVYVRGFIRAYCEQIEADTEEALRLYDEQAAPPPPLNVQPQSPEAPKVSAAASPTPWQAAATAPWPRHRPVPRLRRRRRHSLSRRSSSLRRLRPLHP